MESEHTEIKNFQDLKNKVPSSISSDIRRLSTAVPSLCKLPVDSVVHPSYESVTTISNREVPNKIELEKVKEHHKKKFKKLTWNQDSYEGTVVLDNLHGSGFYFTQRNGEKYFYDGLFYINKLEGYCQIFYENGTHFQGLFKDHLRYGPGILSYPDGSQDVGFWNGFKLIRLACVVNYDAVPSLANTQIGKTKLLCSRYMVPLCNEKHVITRNTLENTEINEDVLENVDAIFNLQIRNPNSLFFHQKFYDDQFFGGQDCTIKVLVEDEDDTDSVEQDKNGETQADSSVERADNLRTKIQEVNESLQSFVAIRQNISQRLNKCEICCKPRSDELSEIISDTCEPETDIEKSTLETINIPFETSLETIKTAQSFDFSNIIGEDLIEPTLKLSEYVCSCEDDEFNSGLEPLEEQLRNVSVQEIYYRNIRDELQKKLDRIVEREVNKNDDFKYKLVKITELWAWNNEDSLIQMQKHSFTHRNSEDMVNFSVPNLILGNRKEFGATGKHEYICKKFLLSCSNGNIEFVKECLRSNTIHPNIADAKGNNGIFFASAKNQNDIISVLRNFGAKLDQLNDEQLTPLSLCLLQYIATKKNCLDWEISFLPETKPHDIPDIPKWYDIKSFLSVTSSKQSTSMDHQESSQFHQPTVKIINRISPVKQKRMSLVPSKFNISYIFDVSCTSQNRKPVEEESNSVEENELECICSTIITLLNFEVNPNACDVPFPPLILSLFTENPDLVKEIIKANADMNVLIEGHMSCLHVAASLKPCISNANICMVLVKYGCNSNLKTLPSHWIEKRSVYTGNIPENFEIEDLGKNALHLLCMRTDFEDDRSDYFCLVALQLLETDIDKDSTYLGHTYLSLAVLSGNINLTQCLIKANVLDPYTILEYGMGNILTLYALKRFENVLPTERCKAMLTALFDVNVNILNKVDDAENTIVFAEDEDNYFDQFMEQLPPKTGKKEKTKPKTKEKHAQKAAIIECMKNIGRQTIIKQIQMTVTEILYDFVDEGVLEDYEISVTLGSEYLTPQIVVQNLLALFRSRKIKHYRLDDKVVKNLLEFVNLHKKIIKKAVFKAAKTEKGKHELKRESEEDMGTIVQEFKLALDSKDEQSSFLNQPGLDEPSKYKICFHCLRSRDKNLKTCPCCHMVHFCSVQCNKLNLKLKTQHGCNILFYDMTDEQITNISKGLCLNEVVEIIREKCTVRWQNILEAKRLNNKKKLLELWRADTYGTKFLKMKPLVRKNMEASKAGLFKEMTDRKFPKKSEDASYFSLEAILLKLQGIKKSEATLRTRQGVSTKKSTVGGIFETINSQQETSKACRCSQKPRVVRTKTTEKPTVKKKQEVNKIFKPQLIPYMTGEPKNKFQDLVGNYPIEEKSTPAIKKLKKIPVRYQRFIEVIGTYFPEIDFSFWLLPYACCSDGQLYYKFCNNDLFKESYSFT